MLLLIPNLANFFSKFFSFTCLLYQGYLYLFFPSQYTYTLVSELLTILDTNICLLVCVLLFLSLTCSIKLKLLGTNILLFLQYGYNIYVNIYKIYVNCNQFNLLVLGHPPVHMLSNFNCLPCTLAIHDVLTSRHPQLIFIHVL